MTMRFQTIRSRVGRSLGHGGAYSPSSHDGFNRSVSARQDAHMLPTPMHGQCGPSVPSSCVAVHLDECSRRYAFWLCFQRFPSVAPVGALAEYSGRALNSAHVRRTVSISSGSPPR